MNTTILTDEHDNILSEKPGLLLARIREKKGFSQEYIASKLHLRVRLVELLETDNYELMPEPVFVKGYLRAYAKLMDAAPDPFIAAFNSHYSVERKLEKALWQSRRQYHGPERAMRWISGLIVIMVIIALALWWQTNKEIAAFDSDNNLPKEQITSGSPKNESAQLNNISKLQSLFKSNESLEHSEK